ncbi:MAG: hypothetical protein ACI97B_001047 [Verrucomicrobiales bacterium]|jgi:hypothetical protein
MYNFAIIKLRWFFALLLGMGGACAVAFSAELPPLAGWQSGRAGPLFPEMEAGRADVFAPRRSGGLAEARHRFTVGGNGLFRISRAALLEAGFAADQLVGEQLRLFNRDREVACLTSTDGLFVAPDYLLFYGEAFRGAYSNDNVYWIAIGGRGLRMQVAQGAPLPGVPDETAYRAVEVFDPDRYLITGYLPYDDSFDHWFAEVIVNTVERSIPFATDEAHAQPDAELFYRIADRNATRYSQPNQPVQVKANDALAGTMNYSGTGAAIQSYALPMSSLSATTSLSFLLTQPGVLAGYVQDMVLSYDRRFVARNGQLMFCIESGYRNVSVSGFAVDPTYVLDITNPVAPQWLSQTEGAATLRFGSAQPERRCYFLSDEAQVSNVSGIESVSFTGLGDPGNRADYLVITHEALAVQAQRLADYRQSQGLTSRVVFMEQIYDEFGYGLRDADALKQFIGYARHHWQRPGPQYVVLIGDATYDPKNNLGQGWVEHVPTHMGSASFHWSAQDMWFGTVEGSDMLVDVALGRISTDQPAVFDQIIDKIQAFEAVPPSATWQRRASWIADRNGLAGDFKGRSEQLKTAYFDPNGTVSTTGYLDDLSAATVAQQVLNSFAGDRRFITYIGHGLHSRLGEADDLFNVGDAAGLNNGVTPVVSIFACQSGHFHAGESLTEALVEQRFGAVAAIAATTEALEVVSAQIAHGFYESVMNRKTYRLGRALQDGFTQLWGYNYNSPELLFYNLFGDPALVINPIPGPNADSDGDGLLDGWESLHGLEPFQSDAGADPDEDGLSHAEEAAAGTHPLLSDSDGDGLGDAQEVYGDTDPTQADTDADGMPDGWELAQGLNPMINDAAADADGDGLSNLAEWQTGSSARQADSDFDGVSDLQDASPMDRPYPDAEQAGVALDSDADRMPDAWERAYGLDPAQVNPEADADGDGLLDLFEWFYGTRPDVGDSDGDGLSDGMEIHTWNTDPADPDTDSDGLSDGDEVNLHGSDPRIADSDGDGLADGWEIDAGMNPNATDSDADSMPDAWEHAQSLNPRVDDRTFDLDEDGLTNLEEYTGGTKAYAPDTDFDGLSDGDEVQVHGTNPLLRDSDNDGVNDGAEIDVYLTNPLARDTDGDGMWDGWETAYGLNPHVNDATEDSDGDGLSNSTEFSGNLNPMDSDSDHDGLSDLFELSNGGIPRLADRDRDGLLDGEELALGTGQANSDSDSDGLKDGLEVHTYLTNPLVADTDGDGMNDSVEVAYGTDPRVADADADPDGDGLTNAEELLAGAHPQESDTDDDGLSDGDEVHVHGTNAHRPDSDGDGLTDGEEVLVQGTMPGNRDSDGDRMPDGYEVAHGLDPLVAGSFQDTDGDGLVDLVEYLKGTHPARVDTDGDGLSDALELLLGSDPLRTDSDGDALSDGGEYAVGYDLLRADDASRDSDGDYVVDFAEWRAGTDPFSAQSRLWIETIFDANGDLCVHWTSVAGKTYRIAVVHDLRLGEAGLQTQASGIPATPPMNIYPLPNAVQGVFRVEVE